MATLTTDLIDKIDSTSIADKQHGTGEILLHLKAVSEAITSIAADDTIEICELPAGATLIPERCSVSCEDPGTSLVIDIGTEDDPDQFADAIVLSAGGNVTFAGAVGSMPLQCASPARTTEKTRVIATAKTVSTITSGTKLIFSIVFSVRG